VFKDKPPDLDSHTVVLMGGVLLLDLWSAVRVVWCHAGGGFVEYVE
jgi:hypothetical protein